MAIPYKAAFLNKLEIIITKKNEKERKVETGWYSELEMKTELGWAASRPYPFKLIIQTLL